MQKCKRNAVQSFIDIACICSSCREKMNGLQRFFKCFGPGVAELYDRKSRNPSLILQFDVANV